MVCWAVLELVSPALTEVGFVPQALDDQELFQIHAMAKGAHTRVYLVCVLAGLLKQALLLTSWCINFQMDACLVVKML